MLPAIIAALAPILIGEAVKATVGDTPAAKAIANGTVAVASELTGIKIETPEQATQAAAAIKADPEKLAEWYRRQAELVLQGIELDNRDRGSARSQTVELAKAGSPIAWGAPIISMLVLGVFGVVLYRVVTGADGAGANPNATLMLGALTTMASAVVSYWVGSSAGSAAKNALLMK